MINNFHTKGNNFLSNFYPCTIKYKRITYKSSEAAYMSEKQRELKWKEYCASATPAEIKKKSKTIKLRDNWEQIKIQVMFDVLRLKFQIPELREKLLATGDQHIEEGNHHHDLFWGVDLETGLGRNFLGRILMHIRDEIRLTQGNQ